MRGIQRYLPKAKHTEVYRIFVNATPEKAWEMARHFNMAEVPWIRALFSIRTLPERIGGHKRLEEKSLGVDDITSGESGFIVLDEIPGKEVVIGSIGKFWHLKIPFLKITPDAFTDFHTPGYGKLAWAITTEPFRSGSTISIELRTSATDDETWKKFSRYYSVIGIGSRLIRSSVMTRLEAALGKMQIVDEYRSIPGDEVFPDTQYSLTNYRVVEAPVSIVWRYLMQLGCDRGGWYSIDSLDNGGRVSTDHLVRGWESRALGEKISATPQGDEFFRVQDIEHEKYMVIGGEAERLGGPFKMNWTFFVEPVGADATRLVTRARMESSPKWVEWMMGKIIYPPVHKLMSQSQLDHIKKLAERDAQSRCLESSVVF